MYEFDCADSSGYETYNGREIQLDYWEMVGLVGADGDSSSRMSTHNEFWARREGSF